MIASETHSLKQDVFEILDKYHDLEPLAICRQLQIPYKKHGATVANYKTEWKSHFKNGVGSSCPTSQHNVRAFAYVPKSCDRTAALAVGWQLSKNRNKTLLWKRSLHLGRVEWFTSGKVLVYVRKPFQNLGKVKQILSDAFCGTGLIFSSKLMFAFLDSVHWKGSHDTFEFAERLPYRVIDNYVESHGIKIVFGDISHPSAVEVQWVHPDWLERLELLQHQSVKTIETNSQQIEQFSKFLRDLSTPKQPSSSARSMVV